MRSVCCLLPALWPFLSPSLFHMSKHTHMHTREYKEFWDYLKDRNIENTSLNATKIQMVIILCPLQLIGSLSILNSVLTSKIHIQSCIFFCKLTSRQRRNERDPATGGKREVGDKKQGSSKPIIDVLTADSSTRLRTRVSEASTSTQRGEKIGSYPG